MLRSPSLALALALATAAPSLAAASESLRGSRASMLRQNQVAREMDYTFLRTPGQVDRFVEGGYLVRVEGNGDYAVAEGVSYPFARPELLTFVERLGSQYREGCGEKLVVTSLTRPTSEQPGNSHPLSVHPTGMAVDLRISRKAACREWLEGALLSLESRGLLDITRERRPPHYHVAVFPGPYMAHVERQLAAEAARVEEPAPVAERAEAIAPLPSVAVSRLAAAPAPPAEERGGLGPLAVMAVFVASLLVSRRRRRGPGADQG